MKIDVCSGFFRCSGKNRLLILCIVILLTACHGNKSFHIKLYNPNAFTVEKKVVTINRDTLEEVLGADLAHKYFIVKSGVSELPVQFDDIDFDSNWDEMSVLVSFDAKEKKELTFTLRKQRESRESETLTSVYFGVKPTKIEPAVPVVQYTLNGADLPWDDPYYPFQMDGPAWENDKVGFRIYFDGRNAKDIFAKRIPDLVLSKVGLDSAGNPVDNYHVLEKWGRDVLQVGNSLGAGGLALYEEDSLIRLGIIRGAAKDVVDSSRFELINRGPVRAVFRLSYFGWKVKNKALNIEEIISINPGEYCYHSRVRFLNDQSSKDLVIGMANLDNSNPLHFLETSDEIAMFTHDKQTYNKEYYLGMALVTPKKTYSTYTQATDSGSPVNSTFCSIHKLQPNEALYYRYYACCELSEPGFADRKYFADFIRKEINTKDILLQF